MLRETPKKLREIRDIAEDAGPGGEHTEIRIWLRLLGCTTQIENILKSRLRQEFGISLARFDILAQLDRFAEGLTMSELSLRLMVSNGAITALVDKLAAEKLITRREHPDDKRTTVVRLTEAGRAAFHRMAKRHQIGAAGGEDGIDLIGRRDVAHAHGREARVVTNLIRKLGLEHAAEDRR